MKNIVILHFEDGNPSGVVRYIQMLKKGLSSQIGIKVHSIILSSKIIFCKIHKEVDCLTIYIPFFAESDFLRNDTRARDKYFITISNIVTPYLQNTGNLLWHVQELFMVKLAKQLSEKNGGAIITHLHIIPWKFFIDNHQSFFNTLYKQWLNRDFNTISTNELESKAYLLSDKIICVSHSAQIHIESSYKIPASKCIIIYNGLSMEKQQQSRRETHKYELLFVGRATKGKGIFSLLNALKKVKKRGYLVELNLAGQCSDTMSEIIHFKYKDLLVNILGILSYEDLQQLYLRCTIGVVPSLHEQCSYTAIEMMMFGMPMIVSDVDALSEMFEDEVNALKVPLVFDEDFGLSVDEEKLASAIIRLIEDETLRQQLGRGARENYEKRFTLEQMIQNTVSVYEQL